jgi:hypothetical protein
MGFKPVPESILKYKNHLDSLPPPVPLYSRTVWDYHNPKTPSMSVENIMKIIERQQFMLMMRETVKFT